jgi:hypothetical protein
VTATPRVLWPPNHKFALIWLTPGATITGVTQDEPLGSGGSGGSMHAPDAMPGPTPNSVFVRQERAGTGNGRVYRINFTGTNLCNTFVTVGVPHDQGPKGGPFDSGQSFNSFG